ncbi:M10 family metallopeptidase C-terminal domain-containing protein [Microvirga terrae]|uniref:M10 family metallopeptidase C-terminal domain-containing protein n=1 Tax=Microvirga terrae TaxID=2740529 RepID=A0ABY5RZX7_9HYPH|nr:calcium-binding protein [Microvirga terrae]UVF21337.1 M10 family metallopeptidase C-terminal domain-containing protein [Microvirga terrae]
MPFHIPPPDPTTPRPTTGNDIIDGTNGNDVLEAYIGNDLLRAGAGNDILVASVGNHTLEGGLGDDQYVLTSSASTYLINDVGGTDTIDFAPYTLKGVYRVGAGGAADPSGNDLYLVFSAFTVTVRNYFVTGGNGGHIEALRFNSYSPFEESVTWQMGDVLNALQQSWPSMEDEFLYADPTGLPTLLDGGLGNDYLHSYFANDTLLGGAGNDTLLGSRGDNILQGGTGDDFYKMEETGGTDILFDEGGNDRALVAYIVSKFDRTGDDLCITSTRNSKLTIKNYFSEAPGTAKGLIEDLWLGGYEKDWSIPGRNWSRAEILEEIQKNDPADNSADTSHEVDPKPHNTESQSSQDDPSKAEEHILRADGGRNVLAGSSEADVFIFSSVNKAGLGKDRDIIVNFEHGVDTIDLSGIDANTKVAGNNAFKALLTGKKPFTKAGQLHYDAKKGILSGNTDKDAAAEFQIQIKNKPELLKLTDFVL